MNNLKCQYCSHEGLYHIINNLEPIPPKDFLGKIFKTTGEYRIAYKIFGCPECGKLTRIKFKSDDDA